MGTGAGGSNSQHLAASTCSVANCSMIAPAACTDSQNFCRMPLLRTLPRAGLRLLAGQMREPGRREPAHEDAGRAHGPAVRA